MDLGLYGRVALVERTAERFGGVEALITNAGGPPAGPLTPSRTKTGAALSSSTS